MKLAPPTSALGYAEAPGPRPARRLDPVETLWTVIGAESRDFLVLPDGRADLIIRCRVSDNGTCSGAVPMVVGPSSRPHTVRIARGDCFVGVRLRPGRLSLLKRARDLIDRRVEGVEAVGRVPALASVPTQAPSIEAMVAAFMEAVATIDHPAPVHEVEAALDRLHLAGGRLQVGDLGRVLGIGTRRLHRLFCRHVGLSTQTYAAVLRFQRAVRLRRRGIELVAVTDEAGYSDQAHMTRAFRHHGGFTPARMPDVALGWMPLH